MLRNSPNQTTLSTNTLCMLENFYVHSYASPFKTINQNISESSSTTFSFYLKIKCLFGPISCALYIMPTQYMVFGWSLLRLALSVFKASIKYCLKWNFWKDDDGLECKNWARPFSKTCITGTTTTKLCQWVGYRFV